MRVFMKVPLCAMIGFVFAPAIESFIMGALMRIRELVVKLFVAARPSIFIIMGQRGYDGNAQN